MSWLYVSRKWGYRPVITVKGHEDPHGPWHVIPTNHILLLFFTTCPLQTVFPRMWTEPRAMQWFSKTFRRSWQPQMFIMKSDIFRISSHLVISQFCELENYHFNAGWWFGTWILWLSISWECHHPNWRTPSFFRGVGLNHQVIGQSSNFKGKITGKPPYFRDNQWFPVNIFPTKPIQKGMSTI